MKNKSIQLTVLFVLVLFMAQIFTPFVVAQAQSEYNDTAAMAGNLTLPANVSENTVVNTSYGVVKSNRLTFVLGTDENRASLENASIDAAVNATIEVMIYNATEAKSADFSNESVVFLASLDNETVASINQTINESAHVFAYNLTTNVSIGNVEDINITKYWVYGGEENIKNLISHIYNTFYGGTTSVNLPKPPDDRVNMTYLLSDVNRGNSLRLAANDPLISKYLNITVITQEGLPDDLNLASQDIIFLQMLSGSTVGKIMDTVETAKIQNNATVVAIEFIDPRLGTVNRSSAEYDNITKYWDYMGDENMRRLTMFVAATYKGVPLEIQPPVPRKIQGLYHPDAPEIFDTTEEYLNWYNSTGMYNPDNMTIGISYYKIPVDSMSSKIEDALIRSFESKGVNAIFATIYPSKDPNATKYFIQDNTTIVDAMINLKGFTLWSYNQEKGLEYLKKQNVSVLRGISCYYQAPTEWENSTIGLSSNEIVFQVCIPELDGVIEPIVIGGKVKDPVTGNKYQEPIDYQIDWFTDRAINHAKLRYIQNSDRNVAIIYYNHGGGKDNAGALYLDIAPSMTNLLNNMSTSGYNIGNATVPNGTELLDLMQHQGLNIGTWAPGELDKMIATGKVVLWPVEEYLTWFHELPVECQNKVNERWGPAPGEIMAYTNESGSYFVIPQIQFGNIIIGPQPTRGWLQDQAVLYHDKELVPHHQYLAYYFWLQHAYKSDAIIHFGTHGTQEWLPGRQVGLSRYDWPSIMVGDMPVIYPYVMDDVGEGIQAKRRGNAVIVDHLTPPIVTSGLYGNLSILHVKIHAYLCAQGPIKTEYRETITELYDNLSMNEDLDVPAEDIRAMNEIEFESFVNGPLHLHLHELEAEYIPYGLHVLGSPPEDWKLISMVASMISDDLLYDVSRVIGYTEYPEPAKDQEKENKLENCTELLLREVIFNDSSPEKAQEKVLGPGNVSSNVTVDLETARSYAEAISNCTIEIPRVQDGLSGGYVPPKVGNDPIRNPDALPTGNNFYSFDSRLIPTKEAWAVGKVVADELLEKYKEEHNGSYPRKVAFVVWDTETIRHEGVMESQILYLMGVEPVWDHRERIDKKTPVKLIPCSELGRPRIDVLITASGLYRDILPDKIKLLDKAVRLAAQAEETECANYVKENSQAIYDWLKAIGYNETNGYNETDVRNLSMARIFSPAPGAYGTGLEHAIGASNTWENETKLAELYINRLGYVYGEDGWGVPNVDLFKQNLAKVEVAVHSRTSNLLGAFDNDDYFSWLGGLALAVRSVVGEPPDLYVTNLRNPHDPKTETLKSFMRRELSARYFNPKWMEGMMEHDYAGAREMMRFTEFLWGWDVATPDLITEDMWNQVYDVYIQDKYDLGLNEFFDSNNPYAQQSISARMLETIRKGYWDPSEDVKTNLAETYQKSVEEYGVTCCHHTCGNVLLQDYMQGIVSASALEQSTEQSTYSSGGGAGSWSRKTTEAEAEAETEPDKGVINATETTGVSKLGEELKKPPEKTADEKRGKVMKEEKPAEEASPAFPISGAPLMGIIAVIVALVLIGIGLGYKRRRR